MHGGRVGGTSRREPSGHLAAPSRAGRGRSPGANARGAGAPVRTQGRAALRGVLVDRTVSNLLGGHAGRNRRKGGTKRNNHDRNPSNNRDGDRNRATEP